MSKKEDFTDPSNLMDVCINYIGDWNVKSSFVLEGRSGAGKSQFLIQLMRQLNHLYRTGQIVFIKVYYFRLREYSESYLQSNNIMKPLEAVIRESLQSIEIKSTKLLFLLDGYDEYNNKMIKIDKDLIPTDEFPNTKIILTVREKYATPADYSRVFGNEKGYSIHFICPFN